jgi:dolichyldiphosphatase
MLNISGDLFGKLLAWSSLSPMGIGAGFIALILFRRDLHTITFFLGTLVNECFNLVLKHWFKQPRPLLRENMYSGYGMVGSKRKKLSTISIYLILIFHRSLHHMHNSCVSFQRT